MQLLNKYYFFEKAIKEEICNNIIDIGLKKIEENKKIDKNLIYGKTFGNTEKQSMNKKSISSGEKTWEQLKKYKNKKFYDRNAKICWLSEKWMFDLFKPYVDIANEKSGWHFDIDYSEDFQFTVYDKTGFHGWHYDGASDTLSVYKPPSSNTIKADYHKETTDENMLGKVRKISMTLNLTDPNEYTGGNLKFDFGQHNKDNDRFHTCEHIRPKGSIIFFPSFLYHTVTPIKKGTRYSLVTWFLGKPFR